MRRTLGALALLLGLAAAAVVSLHPATWGSSTQSDPTNAFATLAETARGLPVITEEQRATIPDYRRESFGAPWADIDGNGCRQRDDVLARDLDDARRDTDGCTVLSGTLDPDPYTGSRIPFEHDRIADEGAPGSAGIQIDHIVSLSAAHWGGAWAWSDDQRIRFANELDNVIAVDGDTNQAKNDSGPAEWLPPNPAYTCTYVAHYTQIVDEFDLAVAEADRTALVATLTDCASSQQTNTP